MRTKWNVPKFGFANKKRFVTLYKSSQLRWCVPVQLITYGFGQWSIALTRYSKHLNTHHLNTRFIWIQWGSVYWTSLVFKWSEVIRWPNGLLSECQFEYRNKFSLEFRPPFECIHVSFYLYLSKYIDSDHLCYNYSASFTSPVDLSKEKSTLTSLMLWASHSSWCHQYGKPTLPASTIFTGAHLCNEIKAVVNDL